MSLNYKSLFTERLNKGRVRERELSVNNSQRENGIWFLYVKTIYLEF